MAVTFEALFECNENERVLTVISPDGTQDKRSLTLKEISTIKEVSEKDWTQSGDISKEIGEPLFNLLNGDRQLLVRALKEADSRGERLNILIRTDYDLPFELLYHAGFLTPSRAHLIRRVSNWGCTKELKPKNRPLRVLFMACSPEGLTPALEYEKEEETIFKVTRKLPLDMDVEDTGSLQGLGEQLIQNQYDVIHISGHADIEDGTPYFWMEDEEGNPVQVTPSELWGKLKLNPPRLLFLSGCKTGQTHAAHSFAHFLVKKHNSTVLGWGLPVTDPGATIAAEKIYFELSRGNTITDAVYAARQELFENNWPDWSLLRLFSDGTPLEIPLVHKGIKWKPKPRDIQYVCLENSQVKVLKKGFIGRRRQIQRGITCLKKDEDKIGLLLHGTGGLGKSCLAGKFCERFKDHVLIVVHGKLNAVTFFEALKDAFIRANDDKGLHILEEKKELPEKIRKLCSFSFRDTRYLILLDDFEKNLQGYELGSPTVSVEAVPILETLLTYLPYAVKMTQLIVTSRYTFSLTVQGEDVVKKRLGFVGLTSFRGADEQKRFLN